MSVFSRAGTLATDALRALLAVSTYEQARPGVGPDDEQLDRVRKAMGGNLSPLPQTRLRWYFADLERAAAAADGGDLSSAAQLYRAFRRDGVLSGLLSTCTDGLVRLPKRFYGDTAQIRELEPRNGSRSLFDEMAPPAELALLAADGRVLGVGVGELVPVQGRAFPVLRRLEPEFLRYRWLEGRWYFSSIAGLLPITPGDGRWVLHCPGGHMAPWQFGLWQALGRAWISKEHALLHRFNYSAKLANPARAAKAPAAATETQRAGFLANVIAWGVNTVFELPPGWEVDLIESNGRGYDVFRDEVETADNEFMVALAGQVVTTTGGAGFANADIHKSIRADIIQAIADGLAYTVNTQIIPPWALTTHDSTPLEERAIVEWDVAPPKERAAEAASLSQAAQAAKAWREELRAYGRRPAIEQVVSKFGVPVEGDEDGDGVPDTTREAADFDETFRERNAAFYADVRAAKDAGLVVDQALVDDLAARYQVPAPKLPKAAGKGGEIFAYHIDAGAVTLDEVRARLGLDPLPDGAGERTATQAEVEAQTEGDLATAAIDAADVQVDPDGDGLPGEPQTDEAVQALADKMTAAGIERCEHGAVNRCRLCGIERVRDFDQADDGTVTWRVIWRPIAPTEAT